MMPLTMCRIVSASELLDGSGSAVWSRRETNHAHFSENLLERREWAQASPLRSACLRPRGCGKPKFGILNVYTNTFVQTGYKSREDA
jgi:hypothetical protein